MKELKAELGNDKREELMEAYYETGFSLSELRELFDLPQNYNDALIVQLFPDLILDEECPLCGHHYVAKHVSRGEEGASSNAYYINSTWCAECGLSKDEIDRDQEKERQNIKISKAYNRTPRAFNWKAYDSSDARDVVLETLVATKGILNNTYLQPIEIRPYCTNFIEICRALYRNGYIEPTTMIGNAYEGYKIEDDGSVSFYWYEVPFAIDAPNYSGVRRPEILASDGETWIEIGEGEHQVWMSSCIGYILAYLDNQIYQAGYDDESAKRDEFIELLPSMLHHYSPAQITSLIWTAMATAMKQAAEGPSYKRTAAWAYGVILKRAKSALNNEWNLKPNMPTIEFEPTFFEDYFFIKHISLGDTWIYRSVPRWEDSGGMVKVANAYLPQGEAGATVQMIVEADALAKSNNVKHPNYQSFSETQDFIRLFSR